MTNLTVGLGVIGCGRIAQVAHLPALENADGIELVALADPSESLRAAVGRRYHVDALYATPAELIANPGVDAVLIATPDRFHFEIASEAMRHRKHILVEKPLATTVAEAQDLAEQADASGVVLQVGAMKRHDPGMEYAKQNIAALGRVLSFSTWYRVPALRPGIEKTLFPPVAADPQVRATENAVKSERTKYLLWTHSAHVFDSIRYLLGDVEKVTGTRSNVGEDYAWQGIMRLTSGGAGSYELTVNTHGEWAEGFQINGENGSMTIDTHFPFFRRASRVRVFTDDSQAWTEPVFDDTNAYERQLEAFAEAIRDGGRVNPDASDGLAVVRLIEAVAATVDSADQGFVNV